MKIRIQPKATWPKPSVFVDLFLVADDLSSKATMNYVLYAEDGSPVMSGHVVIQGEDYSSWDGTNTMAVSLAMRQLEMLADPDEAASLAQTPLEPISIVDEALVLKVDELVKQNENLSSSNSALEERIRALENRSVEQVPVIGGNIMTVPAVES